MKITKLEHACLDISHGNSRLIIDPGAFASSLTDFANITALVITHVHQDHFDESKVKQILEANPEVQVFTTQQTVDKLNGAKVTVPQSGQQYNAGDFTFEFFGTDHDYIFDELKIPQDQNHGVLVNDRLYYPGDSFSPCPKPHTTVAVPSNGPWMKLEEARLFLAQDSAKTIFPTHNGFVNDPGNDLCNSLLSMAAQQQDKTFTALKPSESLDA
jgi:L-ascorbate metabolism protein UlaG (beta-lactamase superfamily)